MLEYFPEKRAGARFMLQNHWLTLPKPQEPYRIKKGHEELLEIDESQFVVKEADESEDYDADIEEDLAQEEDNEFYDECPHHRALNLKKATYYKEDLFDFYKNDNKLDDFQNYTPDINLDILDSKASIIGALTRCTRFKKK